MSKVLQSIKVDLVRARNLSYFGKYQQSVSQFSRIISTIQSQIFRINDKVLLIQWNKLLQQMKYQQNLAQAMVDTLAGNFQTKKITPKKSYNQLDQPKIQSKHSQFEQLAQNRKSKYPFGKQPFKQLPHQDDQLYNKKQRDRIQRQQRQKRQFQQRQAQIWPKKPVKAVKKQPYKNPTPSTYQQPANKNRSGVNTEDSKSRQYSKPWLVNAGKKKNQDQKKSFLKDRYPDGQGPDGQLINMLQRQVVDFCPNINFDDIAQLQKAKDVLQEAVLLPLAMPQLFTGIRRAWKGVLLFGPPGTGKTLLAKAIASSGKTTFFNVTASSLASKWKGQSQKLVRILFQMAKFYAPTTVFIDQIDALASKRGQKEDESSRKVKTQLMTRIDGASTGADDGKLIVVVGATNRPWDLDQAIRRRLEKRIYIPLPTQIGRRQLIKINLKNQKTEQIEIEQIVNQTDGYSGADIANLCRQAAYMPMRRKLKKQGGLGKKLGDGKWMQAFQKQVNVPLSMDDFQQAIRNVKPSVGKGDLINYEKWMKQFGQQGTK